MKTYRRGQLQLRVATEVHISTFLPAMGSQVLIIPGSIPEALGIYKDLAFQVEIKAL